MSDVCIKIIQDNGVLCKRRKSRRMAGQNVRIVSGSLDKTASE